ncbi:MAG: 16S rRNA (guanine(966)-N(2))-methyltransferase RsmD [Oscillospiraceae bacterium]
MRVITGSARGRKLISPEGMDVRPTSDMVKEAVFSIINFEIEGSTVLDLFAGTGQMGIEALSRGAEKAVFIDSSRAAQNIIAENLKITDLAPKAIVNFMDFKTFLSGNDQIFDIAFLDPPYEKNMVNDALPLLVTKMRESGAIICETYKQEVLPKDVGDFSIFREYKYGKIKLTVYRRTSEEQN